MSNKDWYRNQKWNEEIESNFFAKLKRARRKEQYLRIQASTIAKSDPDVALSLLEQYFTLRDNFDHAQAYCDMASAYLAKDEVEKAIQSYRNALDREAEFPNLKTEAYIFYPLAIVEHKLNDMYQAANEVLDKHQDRLMFPIDHFRWHAAKAIITSSLGRRKEAADHAESALVAAQIKTSGFRRHKKLGLVGKEYEGMVNELHAIHA